jgi:putative redox protein
MRSDPDRTPTHFAVEVVLPPGLDDEQRRRLMVIAEKCPVHKLLQHGAEITVAERATAR